MSKTIVFKPKFEAKLKKLRIKTKFVKNFNNPQWINNDPIKHRNNCLKATTWKDFVRNAFCFANTPEGAAYWWIIYHE